MMDERSCTHFHCALRGGKYCCVYCPDPCDNPCLNHPDRCQLSKEGPPSKMESRKKRGKEFGDEVKKLLRQGNMSLVDIAKKMDCSVPTVLWHRSKLRESDELNGKGK